MPAESRPSRVLIIDDNKQDQLIYMRTLQDFELEFASSGEEGLGRLEREWFDLVVLDFQLPGMNGLEVLVRIRSELCLDLPVVFVTGGGSESVAVDTLKRGASDYITKDDLATSRVAAAVRGALERQRLEQARRRAEDELRRRKDELEAALRALQEAQAHLVQSEKMASLGQLVAGVAHEINNPLSYVSNNIAVLDRDLRQITELMAAYRKALAGSIPDAIRELEERIDVDYTVENLGRLVSSTRDGLQRVREIVVGLRDFSRVEEADRKRIDANDAVRATLQMVRYQVRLKGVNLEVDLGELPPVWCSPGRLNQVLLNVIMNAIQAVEPGATIGIKTRANPEKTEVQLIVSDTGPGIPESIRGKIFDPFFTTKPQGLGTGLGLWVSYNIVRDHQGRIDLDTSPERGTTFTVVLPVRLPHDPF